MTRGHVMSWKQVLKVFKGFKVGPEGLVKALQYFTVTMFIKTIYSDRQQSNQICLICVIYLKNTI